VGEQHLDLFALIARGLIGLGLGDLASQIARAFMDRAQNLAGRCIGGKYLASLKLLRPLVVVMLSKRPGKDANDGRVALVSVESNMAARRHGRATDGQFEIFDTGYLLGQIDNTVTRTAILTPSG
jgi:hypothetical protein